jgi:RNA recognition motif-containing protein
MTKNDDIATPANNTTLFANFRFIEILYHAERNLCLIFHHKPKYLPMHQKATGVNPWMNGFRCRVPLHGRANPEKKKPRL